MPGRDAETELTLLPLVDRSIKGRVRTLLGNARGRAAFVETLYHHPPFDKRYVTVLNGAQRLPDAIHRELKARGAPDECYVISTWLPQDGGMMPLRDALDALAPDGDGTILLCIAGQLAYYEGESNNAGDYQWIVERRPSA